MSEPILFQEPHDVDAGNSVTTSGVNAPQVRQHTVLGRDDTEITVLGALLAYNSSRRDAHNSHLSDDAVTAVTTVNKTNTTNTTLSDEPEFAPPHVRCSACRWFEVTIIHVRAEIPANDECTCNATGDSDHDKMCGTEPPSGKYLVVTAGRTIVPGEVNFRRAEFTDSAYEVIELLTQQNKTTSYTFIPQTSSRAIAHAASFDADLRQAYVDRVLSQQSRGTQRAA